MLGLVLKDFLIQKKYVATAVTLYPLVAIISFSNIQNSILAFGTMVIPYILILGAFYADEKSKADVFINSLPVSKSDVVQARYITLVICIVIGVLIMPVYIKLADTFNLFDSSGMINIQKAIMAASFAAIIYSLEIPLFFKYSMNKMRIISFIVIFVCVALLGAIGGMLNEPEVVAFINTMMTLPSIYTNFIMLLITALIFLISLNISIKFYGNKEF
jgi:ABC-2 type transport system permease protein